MKIGIIGAGEVGMTLATKLADTGHEVFLANSREPESLVIRHAAVGGSLTAVWIADALTADLILLAVPWIKMRDVLTPDIPWNGRILIDTTNIFTTYAPDFQVDDLKGDSGSEIIARLAPGASVVKAFNTLPFSKMFAPTPEGLQRVLFVAGDDATSTSVVAALISDLGLHPTVIGSLAVGGRQMELGGPLSLLDLLTAAPNPTGKSKEGRNHD